METNIVLSEDLVKEVDRVAGRRKRNEFIEAAVKTRLEREAELAALREAVRRFKGDGAPWWSTPELTDEWLQATRNNDEEKLRALGYLK